MNKQQSIDGYRRGNQLEATASIDHHCTSLHHFDCPTINRSCLDHLATTSDLSSIERIDFRSISSSPSTLLSPLNSNVLVVILDYSRQQITSPTTNNNLQFVIRLLPAMMVLSFNEICGCL
jgi:hypothetical protein